MKLLLLGATGRTGRYVLSEALKRGHTVHALVRDKAKLGAASDQLKLFEGSPLEQEALQQAMQGCDTVISTLNISRKSDFPWAKLVSPKDLLSRAMLHIVALAPGAGVQHVLTMSAFGVHEKKENLPFLFRLLLRTSNIGVTYRDHERQEDILRASGLDWTIVRPVGLTNSEEPQQVLALTEAGGDGPRLARTVSRLAVARFLMDAAEKGNYVGKAVAISEKVVGSEGH